MSPVKTSPLPSVRTTIAMLCIALSVVFTGASAADVIDKIQHQEPSAHHHEHMAFSDVALDDHHQDGGHGDDGGLVDVQDDSATTDNHPGAGHHHADGPSGVLVANDFLGAGPPLRTRLRAGSDDRVRSPGSPGPERPPKIPTTSV
jgi:hypothetical protein